MRRLILMLAALVFVCVSLFADISGTGYGETEKEAVENARADLSSRFTINVTSLLFTEDSDDGEGTVSSSMSANSFQSTSLELLGVVESIRSSEDGLYVATCTIPESALPLYETQLESLYTTVEYLLKQTENTKDTEVKKNLYLQLIQDIRKYESYQIIVQTMDPGNAVANKNVSSSSTIVQNEYQGFLIIEYNSLETSILDLQQQYDLGILSIEGQRELAEKQKQIEENRKEQEEMEASLNEKYNAQTEEFIQSFSLSLMNTESKSTESVADLINKIEANRSTFSAIKNDVYKKLSEYEREYEREIANARNEAARKPYTSAELYMGQPTKAALDFRQRELNSELADLRVYYSRLSTNEYKNAFTQLTNIADYAFAYIDELNTKAFTVNSFAPEVTTKIDSYALNAELWSGIATITIGNASTDLYFKLPYEAFTGETVPSSRDVAEYQAYIARVDDLTEFLTEYPDVYSIELKYNISTDGSSEYEVEFLSYSITVNRNGQDEVIYSERISQSDTIRYSSSVNFNDFTVNSDSLVDYSSSIYERKEVSVDVEIENAEYYEKPVEEVYRGPEGETKDNVNRLNWGEYGPLGSRFFGFSAGALYTMNPDGYIPNMVAISADGFFAGSPNITGGATISYIFPLENFGSPSYGFVYAGGTFNAKKDLFGFMYVYAQASLGASIFLDSNTFAATEAEVEEKVDVKFAAKADAGFYFAIGSFAVNLSATGMWTGYEFVYGASLGGVIAID